MYKDGEAIVSAIGRPQPGRPSPPGSWPGQSPFPVPVRGRRRDAARRNAAPRRNARRLHRPELPLTTREATFIGQKR